MSAGLYVAVAAALIFLAGMLTMAGILARYVVRQDAEAERIEGYVQSALDADWRARDPESYIWTCTTSRLPVIPAQRVCEVAA